MTTPSGAVGGVPFVVQPTVAILDSSGIIATNFVGSCYATMGSSPSGFDSLFVGTCNTTTCGTVALNGVATVPFVKGIATFSVCPLASSVCIIAF